jgi:hypothetical protein
MISAIKDLSKEDIQYMRNRGVSEEYYEKIYDFFNVVGDNIFEVEDFLTDDERQSIIDTVEYGQHNKYLPIFYDVTVDKQNNESEFNKNIKPIEEKITNYIYNFIYDNYGFKLIKDPATAIRVNVASPGYECTEHADFSNKNLPNQARPTNHITALCYLNDDFEGGEIAWPMQNYSTKPKPNTLIIFPSHLTHKVSEVLKSNRYVVLLAMKIEK